MMRPENGRDDHRHDALGTGLLTRRAASARLAILGLAVPALGTPATGKAAARPRQRPAPQARTGLVHRGMTYDTGWGASSGELSREVWQTEFMEREIATIRNELRCTSISVHGTDLDRLHASAATAAEHGLNVWIQPRLIDAPRTELLDHMAEAARTAEELRRQGASVTMTLGAEHIMFAADIIPGETFEERIATLLATFHQLPVYMEGVNDLLGDAVTSVRAIFGGPLTYGAASWEAVGIDWSIFDIVGLNHYRDADNQSTYLDDLRAFRRFNKPIVITEFGCCCYEGAEDAGGSGYDIIDWAKPIPELNGDYVRNEQVQAAYIAELLAIYETEGVHGAFVYTFMEQSPHMPDDPRYDYDMACFGVVKIYEDGSEKSYSESGYWEPKRAFHEIAKVYGAG